MAQVLLRRYEPALVSFDFATAWRLRVDAVAPDGSAADPAVFLFRVHPIDPTSGTQAAEFECVCGPYEYAAYPTDEPSNERPYPYIRRDSFTIDVPSPQHAAEAFAAVRREVDRLFVALEKLENLNVVEEVLVGTAPAASESASASASESSSSAP